MIITTKSKVEGVRGRMAEFGEVYYWVSRGCSWKHSLVLHRRKKTASAKSHPAWQLPWESSGHRRELFLGTEQDSRGWAGPTQLPRVDTVAQGTELSLGNAGAVSSTLDFAFYTLLFISLFVTLILVLKGNLSDTFRVFTISQPVNLSLGSCLGGSDPDFRLLWVFILTLKLFCSSLGASSIVGGWLEMQNLRPTRLGNHPR